MLILIGLFLAFLRYFLYPYADIPDLVATIPENLNLLWQKEIYNLSLELPSTHPVQTPLLLLFGGAYTSGFQLPTLPLYLYSCIPYVFSCAAIQLLVAQVRLAKGFPYFLYKRLALLIVTLPSVSYNLISPKNEAFINSLALVFFYICIQLWLFPGCQLRVSNSLKHILLLEILAIALLLSWLSLQLPDNQSDITAYFMILSLVSSILGLFKIKLLPPLGLSLGIRIQLATIRSLLILASLFSFFIIVSSSLPSVYMHLSSSTGLNSVNYVATQGLLDNGFSVANKYPSIFRPLFTILSFTFGTASGYSTQIFTRILIGVCCMFPVGAYLKSRYGNADWNMFVLTITTIVFALAVFPGYSNYKYWVALTPVFLLPASRSSTRILLFCFLLVYLELSFKTVLLLF